MDEKQLLTRQYRKKFSQNGWALLIYYGLMNVSVFVIAFVSTLAVMLQAGFVTINPDQLLADVMSHMGWGYLLAILVGIIILFCWKKKEFCLKTLWKPGKPMGFSSFFAILPVLMLCQAVSQLLTPFLQWLLSLADISLAEAMEGTASSTDSVSMFVYICILAPISEEILFRGLILRELEPFGKKFAVVASAFLFGLFHGNLVQSPYAFLAGLVLGYVAMEHNVLWAMVLHMMNNLLLGDTLVRLTSSLSDLARQLIFAAVIWGFAVWAVIVLIGKRKEILACFRRERISPLCLKCFFTAPGILIFTAFMLITIALPLVLQLI